MNGTLTQRERIKEAHGIWELAIARVAGMTELLLAPDKRAVEEKMLEAVRAERQAFIDWQQVTLLASGFRR